MKILKKLYLKALFNACLFTSKVFTLTHWRGVGKIITHHFFLGFGTRMIIIREGRCIFLGHALSIEFILSESGEVSSCLPMFMTVEKGDIVFYGKSVNQKYQDLKS
ncbi:MAG: hypothetical protein KBB86_02735 [Candidatus Pacebacteria bacterium]|nr:hypothetical protein [Candidatus Paceibacterota bacterium]